MNLGRHQLLQWVNGVTQADYPSIQSLCDGVAYCQIFEAIHPGSINVSRMTFVTKLPIDCLKNLKILESAMKNLKLTMTVSIDKMANGKFQDNIIFTQWLYTHAQKYGKQNFQNYQAFERRSQVLQKQNKRWDEVNVHLLPNQVYMQHQQNQMPAHMHMHMNRDQGEEDEGADVQLDQRIDQVNTYVASLEAELKEKMELNWRTMHMIGKSIDQRNLLYSLLEQIQKIAINGPESPIQKQILRIIYQKPEQLRQMGL